MSNAKTDSEVRSTYHISKEADDLSQVVCDLSDDDARQLIRCLTEFKWSTELKKFLAQNPDSPLTVFLSSAKIERISNGNTFNFVITPKKDSSFLFKVESRFGNTSAPVEHLKNSAIGDIFLKESAGKTVSYKGENLTLLCTEFCPESDLRSKATKQGGDVPLRISTALKVYTKMAEILIEMNKNKCAFPDMKNPNWLFRTGSNNEIGIYLSDTKSIIWITEEGLISQELNKANKAGLGGSLYVWPPEFPSISQLTKGEPYSDISADKLHVYLLGANLYQYLTLASQEKLLAMLKGEEDQYDFSHSIFKSKEGKLFEDLIRKTLHTDPEQRPSMEVVLSELKKIDFAYQKKEAIELVRDRYCIQEEDSELAKNLIEQIEVCQTEDELAQVHETLKEFVKNHPKCEERKEFQDCVNELGQKSTPVRDHFLMTQYNLTDAQKIKQLHTINDFFDDLEKTMPQAVSSGYNEQLFLRSLTEEIVAASSSEDWDKINKKICARYSAAVNSPANTSNQTINQAGIERQQAAKSVVFEMQQTQDTVEEKTLQEGQAEDGTLFFH